MANDSKVAEPISVMNLGRVVGKSAYELAVANGYSGTLQEWLASNIYTALNAGVTITGNKIGLNIDNTTSGNVAIEITANGLRAFVDVQNYQNKVVEVLPETGDSGFFYLIATGVPNEYVKNIWVGYLDGTFGWLNIGTTAINPDNFASKASVDKLEVDLSLAVSSLTNEINAICPSSGNVLHRSWLPMPSSDGSALSTDGYPESTNNVIFWDYLLKHASYIPANSEIVISMRCKAKTYGGRARVYINNDNSYLPFDKDVSTSFQELHCKRTLKYGILPTNKLHVTGDWISANDTLIIHWITLRIGNTIINLWENSVYDLEQSNVFLTQSQYDVLDSAGNLIQDTAYFIEE